MTILLMCEACGGKIQLGASVRVGDDGCQDIVLHPPKHPGRLFFATEREPGYGEEPIVSAACSVACARKLATTSCEVCGDKN